MNAVLKAGAIVAATTRLTTLITSDEVTAPLRYKVEDWAKGAPMYSTKERAQYLINCHRCSSIWAAAVVLALSTTRIGMVAVSTLAASQIALTAINKLENE